MEQRYFFQDGAKKVWESRQFELYLSPKTSEAIVKPSGVKTALYLQKSDLEQVVSKDRVAMGNAMKDFKVLLCNRTLKIHYAQQNSVNESKLKISADQIEIFLEALNKPEAFQELIADFN